LTRPRSGGTSKAQARDDWSRKIKRVNKTPRSRDVFTLPRGLGLILLIVYVERT
jgi:hypothetical protein